MPSDVLVLILIGMLAIDIIALHLQNKLLRKQNKMAAAGLVEVTKFSTKIIEGISKAEAEGEFAKRAEESQK